MSCGLLFVGFNLLSKQVDLRSMASQVVQYSLEQLARALKTPSHRVRYWVRTGALHAAHRTGSTPWFGEDHAERATALLRLRSQGVRGRKLVEFSSATNREGIRSYLGMPPLAKPAALPDTRIATLLFVLAEQLDLSPKGLRAPLAKTLRCLHALGLDPNEAADALDAPAKA